MKTLIRIVLKTIGYLMYIPVGVIVAVTMAVVALCAAVVYPIWLTCSTPFVLFDEVACADLFTYKSERRNHPAVRLYRWATTEEATGAHDA